MGEDYPELRARADFMARVTREEEERFSSTLDKGLSMLEEEMDALADKGEKIIPGETAFKLYDTYGFPLDKNVKGDRPGGRFEFSMGQFF